MNIPPDFEAASDFEVSNESDGERRPTFRLTHRATGRRFEAQFHERRSEDLAMADNGAHEGKWFASEFRPNGRLATPHAGFYCDVKKSVWGQVSNTPSKALKIMQAAEDEAPGFSAVVIGRGCGVNSIYYPTPKSVLQAVRNAVDADMWLVSIEPTKTATLPYPRTEIDLDARNLLGGSIPPKLAQALEKITAAMSPTQRCSISEGIPFGEGLRIEVNDADRQYPHSKRLLLFCDLEGNFKANAGFVRTGFARIGDALAGTVLPRYDDPSSYVQNTIPACGQAIGQPPAPPANCWNVHCALWNNEKQHDKIYLVLRKGSVWAACWGRRDAVNLQTKTYDQYKALQKIEEKRNNGYFEINPMLIPDIAQTLQANGFATDLAPEPPRISELPPPTSRKDGSLIEDGPPRIEELREVVQEAMRKIPKEQWTSSPKLSSLTKDLQHVIAQRSATHQQSVSEETAPMSL